MRLGGVDIPYELLEAHKDGELVFFVGAGASVDTPARLPLFLEMTRQIAEQANYFEEIDETTALDVLLGKLKDRDVDVHEQVRRIINRDGSRPNDLHNAIATLAYKGKTVRIVTTNYDLHLDNILKEIAASETVSGEYEIFNGPAMPLGNDFSGLVHLHGSLDQENRRLIVTDRDFAAAYLLDGWATRFLLPMFAANHVLFIGYSVTDMLMQYIARGLKGAKQSYILLGRPVNGNVKGYSQLERLGIKILEYDLFDKQTGRSPTTEHEQLITCLSTWSNFAGMNQLEHNRKAKELLANPLLDPIKESDGKSDYIPLSLHTSKLLTLWPSDPIEKSDYMARLLKDETLVEHFITNLQHPDWVRWFCDQQEFAEMIDDSSRNKRLDKLRQWYGQLCRTDTENTSVDETSRIAIRALSARRIPPNPVMSTSVLQTLGSNDDPLTELRGVLANVGSSKRQPVRCITFTATVAAGFGTLP